MERRVIGLVDELQELDQRRQVGDVGATLLIEHLLVAGRVVAAVRPIARALGLVERTERVVEGLLVPLVVVGMLDHESQYGIAPVDGEARRHRRLRGEAGGGEQVEGDRLVERRLRVVRADDEVLVALVVLAVDELVEPDQPRQLLGCRGRVDLIGSRIGVGIGVEVGVGLGVGVGGGGVRATPGEAAQRRVALEAQSGAVVGDTVDRDRRLDPFLVARGGVGAEHGREVIIVEADVDRVDDARVEHVDVAVLRAVARLTGRLVSRVRGRVGASRAVDGSGAGLGRIGIGGVAGRVVGGVGAGRAARGRGQRRRDQQRGRGGGDSSSGHGCNPIRCRSASAGRRL